MGGILSTHTKMSRGGVCPGGIMSITLLSGPDFDTLEDKLKLNRCILTLP